MTFYKNGYAAMMFLSTFQMNYTSKNFKDINKRKDVATEFVVGGQNGGVLSGCI